MKSRQTHYCKLGGYINNIPATLVTDRLYSCGVLEEILPNVHPTVFSNIYQHYCENKYTRVLSEAECRYEWRTSQELMLKIRIFFMNSTTHKRRHTYSNQSDFMSTSTDIVIPLGRSSEVINRVSTPLMNYYAAVGGIGVGSSNKTKKNRRVI
jgi:hypothetical protein